MSRLEVEALESDPKFGLLAEIDHRHIKRFIIDELSKGAALAKWYGLYQVVMLLVLSVLGGFGVGCALKGDFGVMRMLLAAVLCSFTVLIVLHEAIHALAYRLQGVRNLRAGVQWRSFVFYIGAHREVVDERRFRRVALAPLVAVKIGCLAAIALGWGTPLAWFFAVVMTIHSFFCAGDIALVAFYNRHTDKYLLTYDDLDVGKTYFYSTQKKVV